MKGICHWHDRRLGTRDRRLRRQSAAAFQPISVRSIPGVSHLMLSHIYRAHTDCNRYLICLTIGPAFLSAAIYLCLGRIVVVYGENISRVQPRAYSILFICCDILSLVLQAAGGALAATADTKADSQTGVNVMVVAPDLLRSIRVLIGGRWPGSRLRSSHSSFSWRCVLSSLGVYTSNRKISTSSSPD